MARFSYAASTSRFIIVRSSSALRGTVAK